MFNDKPYQNAVLSHRERRTQDQATAATETRCADCFARVDCDKPHTCKAQIRRNRKAEKK
jgi:hypothetical protein